jgi:RND superfamily putative drug exporter
MRGPGLAARAGGWSARHWKTATFGWIGLVALAVVAGALAGTRLLGDAEQGNGQSARGAAILESSGFRPPAGESVLVQARRAAADPRAMRAGVRQVEQALRALPQVEHLRVGAVSPDGRSTLVQFDVAGDPDAADGRVQPMLDAVAGVQRSHPELVIAEAGAASVSRAANAVVNQDLRRAEWLSIPIAFVILLLAFGAFAAAFLPVLLAFSAVLGSIGLSAVVSHVVHASDSTANVMVLMGMAVGVDYSLFYLKREREERARGRDPRTALEAAAATSGHAVLVSGLTVVVACAGLLVAGNSVFVSLGIGAMLVVLVAMLGSLTVLPALLGKLGDRVDRGLVSVVAAGVARLLAVVGLRPSLPLRLRERRTLLQRVKSNRAESRLWGLVLTPVLRFPCLTALGAVAFLVGLALPAFGMRMAVPGANGFPPSLPIVQAYERIQQAFPGAPSPAEVVVQAGNVDAPAVRAGIADLERRALASGVMHAPIRLSVNPSRTVGRIEVPLAGNGGDAASFAALRTLRSQVIPPSLGNLPGTTVLVTGDTAFTYDFNRTVTRHTPLVFAFVLALAFVLLLVAFRSLVVPLTAIVLNLFSVGAAYGVLVWIFQEGHLQGLLDFRSDGAVVTWLPLFLFAILFGLSMDYHVFIVSRIKELTEQGMSTGDAVARGIRSTASTVTSAAFVMVGVFAMFGLMRALVLKQLGVGLAVAVLLDATVIRGVLLPATMKLLGEANWYLPGWLERLPQRRRHEPRPQTEGEREAVAA